MLLGVSLEDDEQAAERLARKVSALRIFPDAEGRMNEPLGEREILCVSQFTLYGDTRRATVRASSRPLRASRPSPCMSASASSPGPAAACSARYMQVALVNDGPVTLLLES